MVLQLVLGKTGVEAETFTSTTSIHVNLCASSFVSLFHMFAKLTFELLNL